MGSKRISYFMCIILMILASFLGGFIAIKTVSLPSDNYVGNANQQVITVTDNSKYLTTISISDTVGKSVVGISNRSSQYSLEGGLKEYEASEGSGVIINKDGYIVTNNHVVEGGQKLVVSLYDGRELEAKVIGVDVRTDLAVVKIEADNLYPAKFGDSDKLQVGEQAVAIGNPGGIMFARSVTSGIISGIDRSMVTNEGLQFKLIQTDAAINPGNSGGALVNGKGEVVGINTIKISEVGFEGMGFAIPSNMVNNIIDQLIATGKVIRPGLGVIMEGNITSEINSRFKLGTDYGVLITAVPGGSASKAGLKANDIIISIDGTKIEDRFKLQETVFGYNVGDKVDVVVVRDGKQKIYKVVLGELSS